MAAVILTAGSGKSHALPHTLYHVLWAAVSVFGEGELRPLVRSVCVGKDMTQNPSSCTLGEMKVNSARCQVPGVWWKTPPEHSCQEGIPVTPCRAPTSHMFQLCSCERVLMRFGGCAN